MAHITHTVRVANPRRTRGRPARKVNRRHVARGAVKNTHRRRRSATRKAPAIRRYTVKAIKKELRRRGVRSNPRTTGRKRRVNKRRVRRSNVRRKNPVLIELGAVNPRRKRRTNVARKRKNTRRRRVVARVHRRRRRNPGHRPTSAWIASRRRVVNRRRHRRYGRRRNPSISGGKDMLIMGLGGLTGVAATKFLPTLVPANITSGLGPSPMISILVTGAGAFVAGTIANKFAPGAFARGVMFGGAMQTISAILGAFVTPSLPLAARLQLSGIGDIVPGSFVVPQNPITSRAVVPMSSGVSGFRRAFGGQR